MGSGGVRGKLFQEGDYHSDYDNNGQQKTNITVARLTFFFFAGIVAGMSCNWFFEIHYPLRDLTESLESTKLAPLWTPAHISTIKRRQ